MASINWLSPTSPTFTRDFGSRTFTWRVRVKLQAYGGRLRVILINDNSSLPARTHSNQIKNYFIH